MVLRSRTQTIGQIKKATAIPRNKEKKGKAGHSMEILNKIKVKAHAISGPKSSRSDTDKNYIWVLI